MNRIDRLFAITVLLQTKRRIRAQDLAAVFEVSERTIYRDMDALNESGIPIIALPGEGYELSQGFYLPTIQLSIAEARALFLGAEMLMSQAAGPLLSQVESALAKVIAALPDDVLSQARQLVEIIQFFKISDGKLDLEDPRLLAFQKAIHEKRVVWIRYHSYNQDETTEREVEPETLQYNDGTWYLNAYCRLRREPRSFRLSRIESFHLQSETFLPRRMFAPPSHPIQVQILFQSQIIHWVRERQHYGFQREEPGPAGKDVLMAYRVEDFREIKPWVLSWGAGAEVLSPPEARQEIRAELKKLVDRLG
jgi:predicted DNA-binding transcriptional regulator YafY